MAAITTTTPSKGLITHFKKVIDDRISKQLSVFNYDVALKHVEIFSAGKDIEFTELSAHWFDNFKTYLRNATGLRSEKPLSYNSINAYFRIVRLIAKNAADARLMDHHVLSGVANTQRKLSLNSGLTLDELQRLAKTPGRVPSLKNGFLFSCLTGLQWKEVSVLQWQHVQFVEGSWIVLLARKKDKEDNIPLNAQALELLGPQGKPTERIFKLKYTAALCCNLNQWAVRAGVLRNISFNTARLTFGQLLLDKQVPLELVSELMGHKSVTTTQKLFRVHTCSIETTKSYLRALSI